MNINLRGLKERQLQIGNSVLFDATIHFAKDQNWNSFEWNVKTVKYEHAHLIDRQHSIEEFILIKSNLFNDYTYLTLTIGVNIIIPSINLTTLTAYRKFLTPLVVLAGERVMVKINREDQLLMPGELHFFFPALYAI